LLDIGNNKSALRKMFVAKDYRGKEFGVAQNLLGLLYSHGPGIKASPKYSWAPPKNSQGRNGFMKRMVL
jgi:hypothetical protein